MQRAVLSTVLALLSVTAAAAGPILIDGYGYSGNLSGNGIQVTGSAPSASATDTVTGQFLGSSRTSTLIAESIAGNGKATLRITGGQLRYDSGNAQNSVDGLFSVLYSGTPDFPANFSGNTGLTLWVKTHNNPGTAFPTTFQVELTSGGTIYTSSVQTLVNNTNGTGIEFLFSTFDNDLINSGALASISSVKLIVDPSAGTNMDLDYFTTSGVLSGGPPGGGGGTGDPEPIPEPTSFVVLGALVLSGVLAHRRRKATSA